MKVKVHMLAFGRPGELREVDVPDDELSDGNLLELVFKYGQNDFQPLPHTSVSVGDVAEPVPGDFYLCKSVGWCKISAADFDVYNKLPRQARPFCGLWK